MKRDGHLKKESRDISNSEPGRMSATARAFYNDYLAAKDLLDTEAVTPDLFGGSPANPQGMTGALKNADPSAPAGKAAGSKKGTGKAAVASSPQQFPRPDEVITPDDMARKIVAPETFNSWRDSVALFKPFDKVPLGKVIQLDGQAFVPVEAGDGFVILNGCVPEDHFTGTVTQDMTGREPGDWSGLLFKEGTGKKAAAYVLLNKAQSLAVLAGDPLAAVGLNSGPDSDSDLED